MVSSVSSNLVHDVVTQSSFLSSISQGCDFCSLVKAQLGATEIKSDLLEELQAYVVLRLRVLDDENEGAGFGTPPWSITVISGLGNAPLSVINDIPDTYRQVLNRHVAKFTASMPNESCLDLDYFQPLNVELIHLWKGDCIHNHSRCKLGVNGNGKKQLPRRMINVEIPEKPFIVETHNRMDATYIALSYCWGSRAQTRTLKSNINAHMNNIPISTLSKTCRDAISVTRLLGYQYLWIDALCIVQDDEHDKESEISRMGEIYRHAELTICAEGSPGAHAGLFPSTLTDPREVYPCQLSITADIKGRSDTRTLAIAGTRNSPDFLGRRGWTLQEEVLTSRALVLGQGIVSWRCTSAIARETDPVLRSLPLDPYSEDLNYEPPRHMGSSLDVARMRMWLYEPSAARQMASRRYGKAEHAAFTSWYALIENYSDRKLTVIEDNLPAVQGIASTLERSLATTYVSGLWAADLARGLLWYVATNDDRHVSDRAAVTGDGANDRPVARNPSWSWAATGKVRVRFGALRYVAEWTCSNLAQISLCSRFHPNTASGESLLAKGPAMLAILTMDKSFVKHRRGRSYGSCAADSENYEVAGLVTEGIHPRFPALLRAPDAVNDFIGEAALDSCYADQQMGFSVCAQGRQVVCLALQKWLFGDKECLACLLLEPAPQETTRYIRIGVGFIYHPHKDIDWEGNRCNLGREGYVIN
ncbi:HET-domain-containing protein [Apiospora saccharicola]|uniref:HET-domain-containing protein n=1 Tax=Apiospora saccharicola TaxID=335842 RepID=A0ABR1UJX4_9PEZI